MTPDTNQDSQLRTYLREAFVYRETYEELYDHIISALQDKPAGTSFEQAINTIINDDFGGHKNLVNIEQHCKKAIVKDVRRHQAQFLGSFFKFPNMLYVLILGVVIYNLLALISLSLTNIRVMFLLLAFIPWFAMPLSYFLTVYIFGDTKRSVKDNAMSNWSMLPFRVFCAGNVLMIINKDYNFINSLNLFWITAGVVLFIIYSISFFKLSRAEFKVNVIQ